MKENKTDAHKERGWLLSLILVVMAVHGILATALFYAIRTQEALDRPWIISLMVLHSFANVIAAAGIWYWKKWALYVYAVSTGLAIFVGLVSVGAWSIFYMIFPFIILGWILRSKWDYFNLGN